jgi:hypothetical protein
MTDRVDVFGLQGASVVHSRLQAAATRGLTRFVGRDVELDVLTQVLQRAAAGHGQLLAIVGEAGMGKSRLLYECVHTYRTESWRVLESASVSYGKAIPYFPVLNLLKRYMQIDDGDTPRTIRSKVTGRSGAKVTLCRLPVTFPTFGAAEQIAF